MSSQARFQEAVMAGDAASVRAMLAAEPHLAAPRRGDGTDPVVLAARHGRVEVLRLLLQAGGVAQAEGDPDGPPTALMAAAEAGQEEAVALLLEYGADPALRDRQGRTAADLAEAAGHHALRRRLATPAEAERVVWSGPSQ
ncbi:ankyrin repeat domain-containing protein [Siccirubricoccus sp. KC 17139]|uniref:Ankyrin repeat domain-containing protein n=1 Tax=Siccirubricoccus soli TaxID=2899147 RepID=A0ABT1D2V7_9PROT|nr:ankyrin repeat domain-containing protein [Siccirubricoccus soli]MCO6416272.1 ankyrin repeat domain-containing protein [Siccirubricoccus soli]MCP2682406.1 ankyrin repeat domain-containing protein [Siccirubricoccus soli]